MVLIYFGQLIGTCCTHLFRRILLVSNPVRPGSEIYGLNLLEAAVPYEAVLSSWFRLPAVNLPSITARQTFVSCFGFRVLMMFHFLFVHYTFSSVWVAKWPPFGK